MTVQIIIDIILAITAIYGAVIGTINQLQLRKQMRRTLRVSIQQEVMQLGRIPNGSGGLKNTPVHVFVVKAVNPGLTTNALKDVGIKLPHKKILTQGFEHDRGRTWFPMDLIPGTDFETHIDAYLVLKAMLSSNVHGKVSMRGYFSTALKQYRSKRFRFNVDPLIEDINRTEGAWRKDTLHT